MSKNIIFCADGTWNGLGQGDGQDVQADATNVLRLFATLAGDVTADSLRRQDEQEKVAAGPDAKVTQIAKYLHGVGDSQNLIRKILGGVFGEGFIERIVRGYTFISRNYAPDDRIYLVGFSRGAYTVRALAGMIARMGLLPLDAMCGDDGAYDFEKAYKLGIFVWARFRKVMGKQSTLLGYLEEFKSEKIDLNRLVQNVGIEAVAVWDTVGALGVPTYDLADASKVDIFEFADRALSVKVKSGFHALAIDEQRSDFEPTLWDDRDGIRQRWFAGAHADVGGGYPTWELPTLSLDWMIARLRDSGVAISPRYEATEPFAFGPIHTPYRDPPFDIRPHAPRVLPANALFHPSVQAYLVQFAAYQPPANLAPLLNGRQLDPRFVKA
ncbi:DUF2235 domain-containing protein [Variovorax ureilyticus]|uniref:DUF2235 domain-containing protein n=1 Tax=Variovorax ureilyticus TaxID=1836198 RepID=UPI003D66CE0D